MVTPSSSPAPPSQDPHQYPNNPNHHNSSPSQSPSSNPSTSQNPLLQSTLSSSNKKPQPSLWSHQETVHLIESYQKRWYALKRGALRTSQWEEIAVTVAARCRAEKGRPNARASWEVFDLMDREVMRETERYRMEMEVMRETERYIMEMESKRMEMILESQRKIVDTIGRAFGSHSKKFKMARKTIYATESKRTKMQNYSSVLSSSMQDTHPHPSHAHDFLSPLLSLVSSQTLIKVQTQGCKVARIDKNGRGSDWGNINELGSKNGPLINFSLSICMKFWGVQTGKKL